VSKGHRYLSVARSCAELPVTTVSLTLTWTMPIAGLLTYTLTNSEFVAAINSGNLEIKIDGPHFLGDYGFIFAPPMTGLASVARIAVKSCLWFIG